MQDRISHLYRTALRSQAKPFRYQEFLGGQPICNRAVIVPTGSGKTAAAVLTWLHQLEAAPGTTPTRLVYCLPMRALVEQTRRVIQEWLKNLDREDVAVYILMGGEVDEDWEFSPTRPTILIGTQDMLLSRALNRGYAMSRYRWPLHFALLNNDCFWVMDEVQLFGSGLATSTQLQAFRDMWRTMGATATWWMSATFDAKSLASIDFSPTAPALPVTRLEAHDLDPQESPELARRYSAVKPIAAMRTLSAETILDAHNPGTLTLVVVNTVVRARSLFDKLLAKTIWGKSGSNARVMLLHSRFRAPDRARVQARLVGADRALRASSGAETEEWAEHVDQMRQEGAICIATQVVEAGLDISAETLITEIAPWAALVQRFGRCNRFGLQDRARIHLVELNKDEALPYEAEDLSEARERLDRLPESNACPRAIEALGPPTTRPPARVIRRHDFLSLFSTEPDLAGGFTDVSRFVRDQEREADVYLFWRDFANRPSEEPRPRGEEICSVPIGELRDFLRENSAWEWNGELGQWEQRRIHNIRPGMTLLLDCNSGGYNAELGWTGNPADVPVSMPLKDQSGPDAQNRDHESESVWVRLVDHLSHAEAQRPSIRGISTSEESAVRLALRWHDIGKAHVKWQGAIAKAGLDAPADRPGPWAKFPKTRSFRPELRHEAASALAAWQKWIADEEGWTALAVYLIAAHHGKVRTVLRTRFKKRPAEADDVFGVNRGDILSLPGWLDNPCVLDVSPKFFGGSGHWEESGFRLKAPGWVEVIADLLGSDDFGIVLADWEPKALGPFRLAMLEACVSIADICASRAEDGRK